MPAFFLVTVCYQVKNTNYTRVAFSGSECGNCNWMRFLWHMLIWLQHLGFIWTEWIGFIP